MSIPLLNRKQCCFVRGHGLPERMNPRWLCLFIVAFSSVSVVEDSVRMEQIVQYHVASGAFTGTVLVARGDEVLLNKGYGAANLERGVANDPATRFRLGSLTKQFTAAAILLLEEKGKLKLSDPVKVHLPDAPAAWDRITLFHLLTNTSGIPSYTDFPDYDASRSRATTPEKLVARFRDKPLAFAPGEQWHYSNSGYVLLGYLIERISGQTYARFLQESIFSPLGLKDTGYDSSAAVLPHRACGYVPTAKGPVGAGALDMSVPFAAGALYSTTGDLWRWERALFGGRLLTAESLRKMTTPFLQSYALGVGSLTAGGRRMIVHSGEIEGFNSYLAYYPDSRVTVAVLANLNGAAADQLGNQLGAVAHGQSIRLPSERQPVAVARAILEQYAGTYVLQPDFEITVSLDGDQLVEQATGQPKISLFAESETRFFIKEQEVEFEFRRDEKGRVGSLVIIQGAGENVAPRK